MTRWRRGEEEEEKKKKEDVFRFSQLWTTLFQLFSYSSFSSRPVFSDSVSVSILSFFSPRFASFFLKIILYSKFIIFKRLTFLDVLRELKRKLELRITGL